MCEECERLVAKYNLPDTEMSAAELRASMQFLGMTTVQLARAYECSKGTARAFQMGTKRVPPDLAIRVRAHVMELEPHGHA